MHKSRVRWLFLVWNGIDFVVYSNHTMIVDHIISDFRFWTQMIETLDNFYVRHIVPEILCGTIFKQEYDL